MGVFRFYCFIVLVRCEIEEGEDGVEDGPSGVFDEELEVGEGGVLGGVGLGALCVGLLDLDGEVLQWGWVYCDRMRRYWGFLAKMGTYRGI